MAAATYTTNLTTLDECNADTGYVEPTASGWTQLNAESFGETDLYIQNTTCISATAKVGVGATLFNNTTGVTIPTDGAYLVWMYWAAPNSLDSETNGGIRTIIGSGTADFDYVIHGGYDTYTYGGWLNLAMGSPAEITTTAVGSPTGTYQYFGWAYNATAVPSKGNPYVVDCMRYGRCDIVTEFGDLSNGYATFAGMAAKNDANDATNGYNRWGLFQAQGGPNYLWKGLMTLGTATNAVDFRDSNKAISVDNTKHVTSGFNKIEINNASSRVDWTNISIAAIGTVSKGTLSVVDNADVNFDGCTFTDMNTFTFQSNSTINDTTFRRCSTVATGGASFDGCLFTNSTAASNVTATSPANAALITNSDFISGGTGHGLVISGTAANITLTGLTWTNYASSDGSTGNEAVYVNIATGSMNLTISGGTTPSVRTAGCSVTVISGAVSATAKTVTESGTAISGARVHLEADTGGPLPVGATVTIANSGTTATVTHTAHGLATNDKVVIRGASHIQNNGVFSITVTGANTYTYTMASAPGSSPTGTITSTFVVLNGTTDVNGEITMSRVFPSNQPVIGRARKSSASPYYKNSNLSGTVNSSTGAYLTAVMISDD